MSYITDKKAEVRRQVEELIENDTLHQGPLEDCLDTLIDSIVSEVEERVIFNERIHIRSTDYQAGEDAGFNEYLYKLEEVFENLREETND